MAITMSGLSPGGFPGDFLGERISSLHKAIISASIKVRYR